jgi:uncharacterized membrane protein YecN with MAPEG domain
MLVTPFFAAVFVLIYVLLSFSVVRHRIGKQVALGEGEDRDLHVAIRVHGNFSEYIPLALLLMWFVEMVLYDSRLAFGMGIVLLVGRVMHFIGMHSPRKYMILRQLGMLATFGVLLVGAVRLLWLYVPI